MLETLKQQQQLWRRARQHGRFLQEMLMTQEKGEACLGAELLLPEVVGSVPNLVVKIIGTPKSD